MQIFRIQSPDGAITYAAQQTDGSARALEGDLFGGLTLTDRPVPLHRRLAPLDPATVFCIGLNYREHARETGAPAPEYPVVFMKGVHTVQHPGQPILIPQWMPSTQVDFECELAVVIGRRCKNVARSEALDYVLGYTCANDVSARDWQKKGGGTQWCRGKGFDTFCPLGPVLVTRDEIPDPRTLKLRTRVNGEILQDSSTSDMIFDVATLIEFLSGSTTLLPGTVILTGTPQGVGMARNPPRFLQPGDDVTVEIDRIGALQNPVALEDAPFGGSHFRL
jgi:2-keto-4-pentenoate hydratase/2-oxohepta-3-ene-1,7-dioic acid hydratase in catechol pathway